ncbi:MAG: hypothetical protein GY953_08125, partial [bacterium]|nr:hypothetical protein [bacterium]
MVYEGADAVRLEANGDLLLVTAGGEVRESAPAIYQIVNGEEKSVAGGYEIYPDSSVGFVIDHYDTSRGLVIDPDVTFSSYLGGSAMDYTTGLALDASGNIYLAGWTDSSNFPTVTPFQSDPGSVDAFVTKINSSGSAIVFATYIGGSGDDRGFALALDASGNAVVTGYSASSDFPLQSAAQGSNGGSRDAFVLKLNSTGTALVFSTYLGGSDADSGNAVALDSGGNIFVAGDTYSTNFPALSAFQSANAGGQDAFLTKLGSGGTTSFSTLLGGAGNDRANGVAADSSGSAYLTGESTSTDFPTASPLQAANGGGQDAFVTKFTTGGDQLAYSTYLGGSGGLLGAPEHGVDIEVDGSGNAYIVGTTSSTNFATGPGFQTQLGGGLTDAVAAKLNASGSALVYSTYLGGVGADYGASADLFGDEIFVTGHASSADFPTFDAVQGFNAGLNDAFLTRLNSSGDQLVFSTYFGGAQSD